MLYTITFNPAIDLVLKVPDFKLGDLNRVKQTDYVAGGKGINMAIILKELGNDVVASGFLGGFSQSFIVDELAKLSVSSHFIEVDGVTRINVKLKTGVETEINGSGPVISTDKQQELNQWLQDSIKPNDVILLAGNVATGMSAENYRQIAKIAQDNGVDFVVDTIGEQLKVCLPYRPLLIKPNKEELEDLLSVTIHSDDELVQHAKELQHKGAQNVIISLGKDGAILVSASGKVLKASSPKGILVNSVGAGDSMVAGFTSALNDGKSEEEAFKQAVACGSATAFSTGIANRVMIDKLLPEVSITPF